jgi:hypothetical protein
MDLAPGIFRAMAAGLKERFVEERSQLMNKKAIWEAVAILAAKKDTDVDPGLVEEEIEDFYGDPEDDSEEGD